jgi:sulfur dioxygenase
MIFARFWPVLNEACTLLHKLAEATSNKHLLFYCAFGERSAMAVQAAQDAGITRASHIEGGIAAWKKVGGALA